MGIPQYAAVGPITLAIAGTPGDTQAIVRAGNSVNILNATDFDSLAISFDGASFDVLPAGVSLDDISFNQVWVRNLSGATNTVTVGFTTGVIRDSRAFAAVSGGQVPIRLRDASGLAITRGQQTKALSLPVALASDSDPLPTYPLPSAPWSYAAAVGGIDNTVVAVTIKAAAGAGVKNYITSMDVSWEALTAGGEFCVRDGAGGTVLHRILLPTAVQGYQNFTFPTPLAGTAATLLEVVTLTASIVGKVYVNARGFSK